MIMEKQFENDLKNKEVLKLCSDIYYWEKPEKSKANHYIRWFILDEQERAFAGNKPLYVEYDIQVDVFSWGEPNDIANVIRSTLRDKGYVLLSVTNNVIKNGNVKTYNKTLRFRFNKYNYR